MAAEGSNTDEDLFRWGTINAGNVVELSVRVPATSTLGPKVTLVNSSGAAVPDSDGNASDGHFLATLAADGAYYAKVEAVAGAGPLGRYILDVDIADLVPPVVTAVAGLPPAGGSTIESIGAFTVSVSEDLDAATVNVVTPRVWTYGGHFYLLTDGVVTWAGAQAQAQALGGHVVTINDAAEQAWLLQTFSRFGHQWIGMTDQAVEGTWRWISGEPVTYTNWAGGQPQSHGSYDWAYLNNVTGQWSAQPEGAYFRAVLEFESVDGDGDGIPDALDRYPGDPWNAR